MKSGCFAATFFFANWLFFIEITMSAKLLFFDFSLYE